ncbi:MAG: hypothetical protein KDA46_14200, partial [Parvularculaceae bacterium]|nr:hypothetical protein [Parvularculaceae bacterium]
WEFFGHDLKRGPGGIREIEFFVQAQQLIGGGKNADFRKRATLDALEAMVGAGVAERETADALTRHYDYLRKVEHRLQMINDEQTHRIPANEDDATRLAVFLGEETLGAFSARLMETFRSTHSLTSPLFHPEEKAATAAPEFSFSGVDNDPDTIAALSRLGFERPEQVADAFRRWQAGETRATRSPRARALLAKVAPSLIEAFARASAPDDAFAAFDGFLRGLPAGVQIFSLFLNRPEVFERLIRIMTVSPYLAREVAKRAYLAEALIESSWPDPLPTREELADRLSHRLAAADGFEATVNAARRWASEESFSVSAQLIVELISAQEAAERFTLIAEASLAAMLEIAKGETERQFGTIDGAIVIAALGRLGARTMTAASDVDLMFIYDAGEGARAAGTQGLDAVTYFARLVRRYLSAVTMPSEEDALYEVDMQLRPSGGKGPAAVSYKAFHHYYEDAAWTWELMALTKARAIAGDPKLCARVNAEIDAIIKRPRLPGAVARDVDDMRERLRAAKPAAGVFDVKTALGGATEIEFIAQYLTLISAADAKPPHARPADVTIRAMAESGLLPAADADCLCAAHEMFETVAQLSRAATAGVFAPDAAGPALTQTMTGALGAHDLDEAETILSQKMSDVRTIYERTIVAAADIAATNGDEGIG